MMEKEKPEILSTEPWGPPEFELNIDYDGRVTAAVRISDACGGCGQPLLDYDFVAHEPSDPGWLHFLHGLGKHRRDHCLDTSSEWFQELSAEDQRKAETRWEYTHGLLLEVKSAESIARRGAQNGPTFRGFELKYVVTCKCDRYRYEGRLTDSIPIHEMRRLVTQSEMEKYYSDRLAGCYAEEFPKGKNEDPPG